MPEGPDVTEIVRRTVQANARLYKGWMDLTLEYLRGLSEIFGGPQPPAAVAEPEAPPPGVVLAEGEHGSVVRRQFLVTNDLGRTLSCELYATEFTEPDGDTISVPVTFEPPRIELAPGEQRVVTATLPIGAELSPGLAYSGAFAIRGLDGFSVPVVLRRHHPPEEASAASSARASGGAERGEPAAPAPAPPPPRRRRSARQKD